MRDVDVALAQISNIHAQLAANTRFLGISPQFNTVMWMLALLVAVLQGLYPQLLMQSNLNYVAVWSAVIMASGSTIAFDAIARAHRFHGRMARTMLKAALLKLLPFFIAGTGITWLVCSLSVDSVWILPGLWQILIGLLGFSVLSNLPRGMVWVACWYILSGILVLGMAADSGTLEPWMMGVPFVLGQLAVAAILGRDNGGVGAQA